MISIVVLETLTIDLESLPLLVLKFHCAEWKHCPYPKWTRPPGLQLTWKDPQSRIKQKDKVSLTELMRHDALVVNLFGPFLLYSRVFIGIQAHLF